MLGKLGRKAYVLAGLAVLGAGVALTARVLRRNRIVSNESAAVAALRAYLSAQNQFKRSSYYKTRGLVYANTRDGSGFPDLYQIGGPGSDGEVLGMIDRSLAEAKHGAPGARPHKGYYFVDFPPVAPDEYCGLIAIPAEYGRTGRDTFVIDVTGTVYNHDTAGEIPSVKWWLREYEEPPEAPVEPVEVPREDIRELTGSQLSFAADLYREVAKRENGNLVFSPYGIYTGLSMCYAGARGGTKAAMEKTLHLGMTSETFHATFQALIYRTFEISDWEAVTVHQANALWVREGLPVRASFAKTLLDHYGAEPFGVDFTDRPRAAARINNWTAENTSGRIRDLITPAEIDKVTSLALTNAVYFKGEWSAKFKKEDTEDEPFTRADGSSVDVPMMKQSGRFLYGESDGVQIVYLPYVAGDELCFVVLLPRSVDGIARLEQGLTADLLKRLLDAARDGEGEISLPRFSFDTALELRDALTELGMGIAFTPEADFTGMAEAERLWILAPKHKALIEVDEEGTVAVGASWIAVGSNGTEHFTFRADHPFIFLIVDSRTRVVIFIGRVMDPGS